MIKVFVCTGQYYSDTMLMFNLVGFFFDVDHLKVFIEFFAAFFCFMFVCLFFGYEACGILAPRPGIKPIPPALGSEVLTTGLPGKSFNLVLTKSP